MKGGAEASVRTTTVSVNALVMYADGAFRHSPLYVLSMSVTNISHRRTGQHPFAGSNRVLPKWRTPIVFTRPRQGEKHINELYCTHLLPHPKCISGRWILVPFGDTNVLSFARINVVSVQILGGKLPPDPLSRDVCHYPVTDININIVKNNKCV